MNRMQTAVTAMLTVFLSVAASAQSSPTVKDDLFAGTEIFAKGATDINEITMDPDSLAMVNGRDGAKAHRTVLNVVRTYSYDKPGMYRIEDVDAFRNKLNTGDWHCSVHTRSLKSGDSTDICNKRRSDDLVETAIITVSPRELTFIHTIRRRSSGEGGGGMGDLEALPIDVRMRLTMPEMQAEMAQARAQVLVATAGLQPQLAGVQPQLAGLQASLASLNRPGENKTIAVTRGDHASVSGSPGTYPHEWTGKDGQHYKILTREKNAPSREDRQYIEDHFIPPGVE